MKAILVCVLFALSASAVTAQTPFNLDVSIPIDRIVTQLKNIHDTEFNLGQIPAILKGIINLLLSCPGGNVRMFQTVTDELPPSMRNYLDSLTLLSITQQIDRLDINWEHVKATPAPATQKAIDDLKKFMKTAAFEAIHKKIWENDEFLYLIGFLSEAGYPDIYTGLKLLYTFLERDDLTLPTAPPPPEDSERRSLSSSVTYAAHPFPVAFKAPEIMSCGLGDLISIITPITLSKLHKILVLLLYTLQEFAGNASMHVLLINIGEPQMGAFVQEVMRMPEMQQLLPIVNNLLLSNESLLTPFNNIVEILTGLTLRNMDLFRYGISAISWLVWGIPFPA